MATKDGGLVETTSTSYHRYVMPPLKLVNEVSAVISELKYTNITKKLKRI